MEDIFYITSNRENNGAVNVKREDLINSIMIANTVSNEFKSKLISCLESICPVPYISYTFEKKGGRGYNYDFLMTFIMDNYELPIPIEFKFNTDSVYNYPQFLSVSCNNYISYSYHDYYYDELDELCEIYGIKKINKNDYDKDIFKCKSNMGFFNTLKKMETKHKKVKELFVNKTIKNYLNLYYEQFDIEAFNLSMEKQYNKIYLLWCNNNFKLEEFTQENLFINKFCCIKNDNTLVFESDLSYIHLLLRWKNRKGILLPAWQVSIKSK